MKLARNVLLWSTGVLAILMVMVIGGLSALWVWTDSNTSLATALTQASRYLPAGQSLRAEDVRGTLRRGGQIGLLRWEKNGLVVEARRIDLVWQPMALLDRRLQLDSVRIGQLGIDDQRPETNTTPLDNLVLPFHVDLTFTIDSAHWGDKGIAQVSDLFGHYQFDETRHLLKLNGARLAAGQYRAQASLMARAPLALDVQLQGDLQASIPGNIQPLALTATASAKGNLAGGPEALLEVRAQIQPATAPAGQAKGIDADKAGAATRPMKATLDAHISPWAAQPVLKADASFTHLNLAVLWPDAPATLLNGNVTVLPDSGAVSPGKPNTSLWRAGVKFTNGLSGPWNRERLPVDAANAQLVFNNGQWLLESLNAEIAGGRITAKGQLAAEVPGQKSAGTFNAWVAEASLQNINPAALHSQMEAARLDGELKANAAPDGVRFETTLRPSARQPDASRLKGLHIKNAFAKGRWTQGSLNLDILKVQTSDALLEGKLDVTLALKASRGELNLSLPGGQARIQGQLSAAAGGGDFSLRVSDASKASLWLEALPGAPKLFNGHSIQGHGEVTGKWTGGWQGSGPELQFKLRAPQLARQNPAKNTGPVLTLREIEADVSGHLSALTLKATGQLERGTQRFTLATQATGGRGAGPIADEWQFSLSEVLLQMKDGERTGSWTAQIQQPVQVNWKNSAVDSVLRVGGGTFSLNGPLPGTATVVWKSVRWRSLGQRSELSTQGQMQKIPLAWLDLAGNFQMASAGLRGDLVFDGDWDVDMADTLRARVSLVRSSGDIAILAEDVNGRANSSPSGSMNGLTTGAGVRDARIDLRAEGDSLSVSARWDSARAGAAQGEVTTRIASSIGGWHWPDDAPLSGSLKAQMPQVGVWSVLAPPGWRIRGTLEASMALAGTRQAPQWSGTLNADSLALRSVADGIEFSNGKLRTVLQGQRLEIKEFSLQGASGGGTGSAGGTLFASGFAQWLTVSPGQASALSKVRIELDAQATNLRVSARADRRMAVSGNIRARLQEARLDVRGALKSDQALFVLPDESTPSLGNDVVVKPSVKRPLAVGAPSPAGRGNVAPIATGVRIVPDVAITLDMGPDFRVQGRGLSTRLAGTLSLSSSAATQGMPRLTGVLNTVGGSYKAYGQALDIEEGVLRFVGPFDNPALDILAVRRNLAVRVGVQISGTALLPRVRLYAEPELPEAEKLAWLVLGRSGANGGAESAVLQQAAMALLGGNGKGLSGGLAEALGLDELSFRGSASNADGTTSAAAVTLGKRLSRNFYVAYERSVAGTLGTVYVFYDLSRRFTLRAQTGEQSAIDLIFTLQYD